MERSEGLAPRVERVGDTVFCYGEEVEPLLKTLWGDLSYLHRPASLEDVFLKLTGRDLRGLIERMRWISFGAGTCWSGASSPRPRC